MAVINLTASVIELFAREEFPIEYFWNTTHLPQTMTDIGDGDLFDRRRRAATHPATAAADDGGHHRLQCRILVAGGQIDIQIIISIEEHIIAEKDTGDTAIDAGCTDAVVAEAYPGLDHLVAGGRREARGLKFSGIIYAKNSVLCINELRQSSVFTD